MHHHGSQPGVSITIVPSSDYLPSAACVTTVVQHGDTMNDKGGLFLEYIANRDPELHENLLGKIWGGVKGAVAGTGWQTGWNQAGHQQHLSQLQKSGGQYIHKDVVTDDGHIRKGAGDLIASMNKIADPQLKNDMMIIYQKYFVPNWAAAITRYQKRKPYTGNGMQQTGS